MYSERPDNQRLLVLYFYEGLEPQSKHYVR